MSQPTLLVIEGVDQGARFGLGSDELGVGRDVHNLIRLHDTEVSRSHAVVRFSNGRHLLVDLNSANGTYVNGAPIQSHTLAHGDEIQLGRSVLLYETVGPHEELQLVAERVSLLPDALSQGAAIVDEAGAQDSQTLANLAAGPTGQALANLQVLYRIAEEAVLPSNSVERLLSRILELAIETTGADRGCVLLRDAQTGHVLPYVYRHRPGVKDTGRMPVSRSIVDYVLRSRQGVRTSDARADARFTPGQSILQAGIREAICVPMQGRYDLQGAMYVDITTPPERVILTDGPKDRFSEDLLRLMVAIGRQSALAVEDNRYHQALLKAERLAAVGQTIAILSHHIKNILQGVRGGSYLIDLGLNEHNNDLVRKGWQIVEKNQEKIYHLVMDMLTFSKDRQPHWQRGNLNETVGDVCDLLRPRADELQIQIDWRPATDLPPMSYDAEGIHRAVLNIVSNALDALEGREPARILVTTSYDAARSQVAVAIADNGPGIGPEMLPRLFQIFESSKGGRGTGIGLAVSRKIIREHGGDIVVESREGAGATFTLEWPLTDAGSATIELPPSA
ncbi:MAG: ATP-binding protein [Planctomycetaceae bacterium]